jgi:hypothetical protein
MKKKSEYAAMIHQREPTVNNEIGFVDGLRLSARCEDTDKAQSIDYSGYSRDTACNNVQQEEDDKDKRLLLILSIVLLSNYRTHYVGLIQIATVFNSHYEQYVNVEGYDRIRRYFI